MSRNMIDYSKSFFEKIVGISNVPSIDKMRIAKEGSEEELSVALNDFQNLKILPINIEYLFADFKVFSFDILEQKYFTITNFSDNISSEIIDKLEEYSIYPKEINTGIFLALVKDADLKISSTIDRETFEEEYLFQQEDSFYQGHTLEDIKKCIESVSIFHISNESVFYEKTALEIAYFLTSYIKKYIPLTTGELLSTYREIFMTSIERLPYENLFLSMTAIHWKHSFLEVYRCIERLFVLPRTLELKKALNLKIPAMDIARHCFLKLGWKGKEEDALKKLLLNNCDKKFISESNIESTSLLENIDIEYEDERLTEKSAKKLAEKIYKVRNSFVHQFHDDDEVSLIDKDLEKLIKFLLQFTLIIYYNYKEELSSHID